METSKKSRTIYRTAKGFISFFMLFSAYYSFTHAQDFAILGFPNYFRIELSIAKVIGAFLLVLPNFSSRFKEWIYAGFMICMGSAFIAHISSGDPASKIVFVAIDLMLVALSIQYVYKYEIAISQTKDSGGY